MSLQHILTNNVIIHIKFYILLIKLNFEFRKKII